jgi:glycosyl transferase family 4
MHSLRVLITNADLWPRSGTVMYVRDVALELQRQGHQPMVFSSTGGEVAQELRRAGIPVADRPGRLPKPDVIHGHHGAPTLIAIRRWPDVPAIFVSHAHAGIIDRTPHAPQIRRYFGVSRLCVARVVAEGVAEERVSLLPNFVDTSRFQARPPLPERPRRALVFSNYASASTQLPAVIEACRRAGIELDVIGAGVGRPTAHPECVLPAYDIVFAKAKAAMEAMAVGSAVVLCDFGGVGPMVTAAAFDDLRAKNFGMEALRDPLEPRLLLREIERYDPLDAEAVRDLIRSRASLASSVEQLGQIYRDVLAEHRRTPSRDRGPRRRSPIRPWIFLRLHWAWNAVPTHRRGAIREVPGAHRVIGALRRLA